MPVKANGFQDRLVMTASIRLRIQFFFKIYLRLPANGLTRVPFALFVLSTSHHFDIVPGLRTSLFRHYIPYKTASLYSLSLVSFGLRPRLRTASIRLRIHFFFNIFLRLLANGLTRVTFALFVLSTSHHFDIIPGLRTSLFRHYVPYKTASLYSLSLVAFGLRPRLRTASIRLRIHFFFLEYRCMTCDL